MNINKYELEQFLQAATENRGYRFDLSHGLPVNTHFPVTPESNSEREFPLLVSSCGEHPYCVCLDVVLKRVPEFVG